MREQRFWSIPGRKSTSFGFSFSKVLAAVSLLFLLLPSVVEAYEVKSDPMMSAMQVRMLQTEMMVAALSCGAAGQYNAFVRKFAGQLVENGRMLRSHFARTHGKRGSARLDAFVTGLANTASVISIRNSRTFCPNLKAIFQKALSDPNQQLSVLAAERAQMPAWQLEHKLTAAIENALNPLN